MADGELPRYDPARIFSAPAGPERDRERYLACLDVVQSLGAHYRRPPCPQPMPGIHGASLESLRERVRDDGAFGRVFGRYRDLVLSHEEQSARRLQCLRSTVVTLLDLRTRASVVDTIDRMLEDLGHFCASEWNVDVQLDARDRDWPLRAARRYDLLSPSLRHL